MRITIASLVLSLGYCCEWAFFHRYRQNRFTPLIADRLGVSVRAIQKHKSAVRKGKLLCANCPGCLKPRLS